MSIETPILKKALIYCRVAVPIDVNGNNSLTIQEAECRLYAEQKGSEVIAVFGECSSALQYNRTALQDLLSFCKNKANGIEIVITKNSARFSRSSVELLNIQSYFKGYNIEIQYVDAPIEGNKYVTPLTLF